MIEITFALAIVVQAVWLAVQTRAHRQEVRALQRRINSLGTELGILKARSHKPRQGIAEAEPLERMTGSTAFRAAFAAAEFNLPDYYRSRRPLFESFSPSWI